MNQTKTFYAGLAALSAVVTSMQILQTRIFSVTTWYHLSFIVISIAMFGLTLGALAVYHGDEIQQRKTPGLIAAKASLMCSFCLLLALGIQLCIPMVFADFSKTFIVLPFVGVLTGLPYYYAGIALSVCLTRTHAPVGKVYGIDLLGAAGGCLGALGLMKTVDTPSGLLLLSAVCAAAALLFCGPRTSENTPLVRIGQLLAVVTLTMGMFNANMSRPLIYPLVEKDHILLQSAIDFDKWNSISRITISKEKAQADPFLWGPSPRLPGELKASYRFLMIDGEAGSVITRFNGHDWSDLKYLDYDVTNLGYHLPGLTRAAIIGVGGGRDLLSARYFGVPDVVAIDVNKIQIRLLRDDPVFSSYSNLYNLPGVTLIYSDARSWFRRNTRPFDFIQMSLIDTWAATGAGAFSLSENGLYTIEGWSSFFDSLAPDGVLSISRWYTPRGFGEVRRQLSLAVATLLKAGITDPRSHIFMAASGPVATMLISRSPLNGPRLDALEKQVAEKNFITLVNPRVRNSDQDLVPFLEARNMDDLRKASENTDYDLSPPTDMRPFFFNQVRFSHPLQVMRLAFSDKAGIFAGHAKATFNLYIMIGFALLMTLFVIVLPLIGDIRHESPVFVMAGTSYFLLIGIGFMLLEISLLQGFGVFLGHPVYGLSIVLFSLILSTGIGSLLSDRLPLCSNSSFMIWCALVFACSIALSFFLSSIFSFFGTTPLPGRAALCVLILLPLGILLGYGFPTGMRLTSAIDTRATAWFWGINGAGSVLSSALAIACDISLGIDNTIMLAGACYALLFPLMIILRSMKQPVMMKTSIG